MMNDIFNLCVNFLNWLANVTGTSYVFVNVVIFCFIWPLLTVWMGFKILQLSKKVKRLSMLLKGIELKKD